MPAKKTSSEVPASVEKALDNKYTFNPLIQALQENDKRNLFKTNVTTAFHKTGYPQFDHFFGSVVNVHNASGKIISQKPRLGQAAGTFNMFVGASQSGKEVWTSTWVPTSEGWKKMGDIQPGDKLYSADNNMCEVLSVHPQGIKPLYKLTLADGRCCECGLEHLWTVYIPRKNEETNKIEMKHKVMDTENIIKYMNRHVGPLYVPVYEKRIDYPNEYPKDGNFGELQYVLIKDVVYTRDEEAVCIFVDDETGLYVIDQMILTHNTTWATQIGANIIRQYSYANCIHFDCEERFDISRCENITKLPAEFFQNDRYMIKTGAVGLDVIQEMVVKTYVNKMRLKDKLLITLEETDEFNNPIKIFEPTVVIIDSITTVLSETFNPDNSREASEAEKMRSNTEGARDAKTLKGFFKDILPICKEANIIVFAINHININMSMNSFTPVAKQQNYLKQDESIPGGKTMLYYPNNIIKLTAKTGDSFDDEADGFAGHIVMVEPLKSSSNQSGNNSKGISFEMVFAQKYGFDSVRSLILYGRDHGLIEGNKNRLKFKGDDSFTFNWKDLNKEMKDKPIWKNIKKYVIPDLDQYLPYTKLEETDYDLNILNY